MLQRSHAEMGLDWTAIQNSLKVDLFALCRQVKCACLTLAKLAYASLEKRVKSLSER